MENSSEEIMKKWAPIFESIGVTNSHWGNLSQLAQNQQDFKVEENTQPAQDTQVILPLAKKIVARTIGHDLVGVRPLGGGNTSAELERIRNEVKVENRDRLIDSISEDKEFEEMKIENHPDYAEAVGPKGQLFYMDFKYNTSTQSYVPES